MRRPTQKDDRFELFWQKAWRKVAKGAAEAAFSRAIKEGADFAAIMAAVELQYPYWVSREPQYRVHPSTWLNQRRWEDDPAEYQMQQQPVSKQLTAQEEYGW